MKVRKGGRPTLGPRLGRPSTKITRRQAAALLLIPVMSVRYYQRENYLRPYSDGSGGVRYHKDQVVLLAAHLRERRMSGVYDKPFLNWLGGEFDKNRPHVELHKSTGLSAQQLSELHARWRVTPKLVPPSLLPLPISAPVTGAMVRAPSPPPPPRLVGAVPATKTGNGVAATRAPNEADATTKSFYDETRQKIREAQERRKLELFGKKSG